MKHMRFDAGGKPILGILKYNAIIAHDPLGFPSMLALIRSGLNGLANVREPAFVATTQLDVARARLLAPIERPGKYLATGMKYRRHAEEAKLRGLSLPDKQLWRNKQTTSLAGPLDDIDPGVSERLDYGVELRIVIGANSAKQPGDLLATGTPEGVGAGMTPPRFITRDDVVRCEFDGIGAIENKVEG